MLFRSKVMCGIPLKLLLAGGGILVLLIALGLHIRADNKMREQIISLQVDLRTSEANYTTCEQINKANALKAAEQQASIDRFADEKAAAIERAETIASQLTAARQVHANKSAQLRRQVQQALQDSDCANAPIPPDALGLLNNAISQASGD